MRYHLLALILVAGLLFPSGGFAANDNSAQPASSSPARAAQERK